VEPVNDAPVLAPIGEQSVVKGNMLYFTASAGDIDSPTLTYALLEAPAGASMDPTTGECSWTPAEDQGAGSYTLIVQVTDGELTDEETVTVIVTEPTPEEGAAGRRAIGGREDASVMVVSRLYPNPVTDKFSVILNQSANGLTTTITDATGRVQRHTPYRVVGERQLEVDATTLQSGLYLLRLQTQQGYQLLKFIKH
jgi:hypothetical protein